MLNKDRGEEHTILRNMTQLQFNGSIASFFDVTATAGLQHLELVNKLLGVSILVLSQ